MPRISSANSKGLTNVATAARSRQSDAPTPQDIRVRAFEIYVANGCQPGRDAQDWAQAERELRTTLTVVTR